MNADNVQGFSRGPDAPSALDERLDHLFSYHAPTGPEQLAQYERIRNAGRIFARIIMQNTPPAADQAAALRKVREAVMTANAAIALGGVS
jgi:hypothetical protein